MMYHIKVLPLVCVLGLAICGPQNHKKNLNKETFDDALIFPRDGDHYKDGKHDHSFDHESILGSHDVAAEFNQLSPEESKERLHRLALKMDANKDLFVDRDEVVGWVVRSFKMLTEEEALDQLEDEDADGDGRVTWKEHAAETYGVHYDDDLISTDLEEQEMLKNDKELFQAADKNKDGSLDRSEFSAFSHPEEFEQMHQIIYDQALRKRDKNKDGFLSFEEFVADNYGAKPVPTTEHYIIEKDRFSYDYDRDGDNKLNKEETLLWLVPNNVEMAENEADHLIEHSDSDKDGKLSIEEIISHYDIFVGSEATDFGEQLHDAHKFTDEL